MFEKREFPILEYDPNPKAKINPSNLTAKTDVPECCVITFFGDVINEMLQANKLKQIATFCSCTVDLPIYETKYKGKSIAIVQGFMGAAGSAALLEELIVMGFKKFIVCGAAGFRGMCFSENGSCCIFCNIKISQCCIGTNIIWR